jgi:hypothetical protein
MGENKGVAGEGIEFLSYPSFGIYIREPPPPFSNVRSVYTDDRSHYSSLE